MAEFDFGKVMGFDKEPDWLAKYEGTDLSPQEKFIAVAKDMQAPGAWDFLTTPELEPYKEYLDLPDGTKIKNPMFGQTPTSYFENQAPILDRLEKTATELGVDPKTDPEFYVDNGQGRINLGLGNALYRNKSDTAIGGYEMEKGGFQFQDAKQNAPIGGITYQKVDTDAFRDTVVPMAGQALAGAVGAGAFTNPLLGGLAAGAASGMQGGSVKDALAAAVLTGAPGMLKDYLAATVPVDVVEGVPNVITGNALKATEVVGDAKDSLSTAEALRKAYDIAKTVDWDPDKDPSWQDQYEEVLYDGDVLFKDTVSDDISEYQPPPIIPQDWPIVDTGTGGNGGSNGGSQDIPSDPTEEPVGGIGLPNPLPPIPDDEDPNEPDKKQPSPSFLQLFMDIKGALGDQQAYDGAGDTPIAQGMLASNGYANRTPYELFENQPFEKTKRMGDFLYDMET